MRPIVLKQLEIAWRRLVVRGMNASLRGARRVAPPDWDARPWRVLFLRVRAGPFFDMGATRDPGGRLGSRGLLYDAGLQVTLHTVRGIRISALYGRDLREGRLVRPFGAEVSLGAYWLTRLKSREETPAMAAFRQWLLAQPACQQSATPVASPAP